MAGTTARSVVHTRPGSYEMRELPIPSIGYDDALLEVETCGICGTDVEMFRGDMDPLPYPLIPGHEPVGRIVEIGPLAQQRWGVGVGDRVAVNSRLACHLCLACRLGNGPCTSPGFGSRTTYGTRPLSLAPGLWGGFSTHMYLVPETTVLPIPDNVSTAAASLFNVFSNGVEWVTGDAQARAGMSLAVLGPGPRGLACALVAQSMGLGPVAITGLASDSERLALAGQFGVDHTLTVTRDEPVAEQVLAALGHAPDIVIDTTPMSVRSVADAIDIVAPDGVVVLAGMKGNRGVASIHVDTVIRKRLRIKGAAAKPVGSIVRAIELIASGRWNLAKMATDSYPLERAAEAVLSLESATPPNHARLEPNPALVRR